MRDLCFLSTDDLEGYTFDDDLAVGPLAELGWRVETLSWHDRSVDWNRFEAVVIRTTWDYQNDPEEFLTVLEEIDRSSARLENPINVVRWNLNKRYLDEMARRGCRIVPTIWDPVYSPTEFDNWCGKLGTNELIIKPEISATAGHTYRLSTYDPALKEVFAARPFLVQPFMPSIETEGEFSLFYFGGKFSHAINKKPQPADFRVQEEFGGIITAIEPEDALLTAAQSAVELIGEELLYARVDLVRSDEEFALMELELIEPALYFRMDERSPKFFAEQFDHRMNEL